MILVEFTGAIDAAGVTRTFYLGTGAFTTEPSDAVPDQEFKSKLLDPGAISISIFSGAAGITGGGAQLEVGEIIATNVDGGFDDLGRYSFDGRDLVVRVGKAGGRYPADFPAVMAATMSSVLVTWDQLIINVQDATYVFDAAVLTQRFKGDNVPPNGLEGTPDDVGGQIVPRTYGRVQNIAPPCVNAPKATYKVNDGPVDDIPAVYIRGAEQTKGVNHATSALLQAATVNLGDYQTCFAEGLFRIGGADGLVTADVLEGAAAGRSAARLLQRLAIAAGVSPDRIDVNDVARLDGLNPAELGRYIDDETKFGDVMDEVARSVGAWYGFDPLRTLRMGRIDLPTGMPLTILQQFEVEETGVQRGVLNGQPTPLWSVTVNHTPIGEVQTSDLAGAVSAERRGFLAQKSRSAPPATKPEVKTQSLLAGSLVIDTLLTNAAVAQAEAARVLAMHDEPQDVFEVPVPMARAAELIRSGLWLGAELGLDLNRFSLAGGKSFVVIGISIQRKAKEIVFRLWGEATSGTIKTVATYADGAGSAAGVGGARAIGQNGSGAVDTTGTARGVGAALGRAPTDAVGTAAGVGAATGTGVAVQPPPPAVGVRSVSPMPSGVRTNTVFNTPPGTAAGDVMLVLVLVGDPTTSPPVTPPDGWIEVTSPGNYVSTK